MKLDNGTQVMEHQLQILQLLIFIGGTNTTEYQRAIATSLHIWQHWRNVDHVAWRLFDANASMWNEESGEVCFSVLARDIASSGVRSDVSKVSEKFELIKMKMETAADLKVDLCGDDFADRKHRTIQMDSKEVQATVVFFRRMITSLRRGCHRHFDDGCGFLDKKAT